MRQGRWWVVYNPLDLPLGEGRERTCRDPAVSYFDAKQKQHEANRGRKNRNALVYDAERETFEEEKK